jgi:hypothetical protein
MRMSWANYKDKVRRYFPFSDTEWKNFGLLVLVFAFLFSFDQWGTTTFNLKSGIVHFLIAIIIVGVSVFVHHAAQRLYGIWFGYRIEHRVWWVGLLAGMLGAVLSNGGVTIFAASAMQAHFLPSHRLGAFRFGPSLWQLGLVAFAGPLACVIVGFLAYGIAPSIFTEFLKFNLYFAAYCMIPLPPLDGVHVFAASRISSFIFTFLAAAVAGFVLVYFIAGIALLWSLLLAVFIGLAVWLALDVILKK